MLKKGKVHLLQLIEWGELGGAGMVGCKDRSALTQVQRFIASFMNLILNICFNYGLETNRIAVCQNFSFFDSKSNKKNYVVYVVEQYVLDDIAVVTFFVKFIQFVAFILQSK